MIGNCKTLIQSGGITWKKMWKYVTKENLLISMDIKAFIRVMKKLETDGVDHLNDPKYAHSRKMKVHINHLLLTLP